MTTTEDRFWLKVEKTDSCWNWKAACRNGYGAFRVSNPRRMVQAHHFSLMLVGINIPDGLVVDHLCRNHSCVNPNHLRLLTIADNVLCGETLPAKNLTKSFCKFGHPFHGENLTIVELGNGRTTRRCKTCVNAGNRKSYQKFKKSRQEYARRRYKAMAANA